MATLSFTTGVVPVKIACGCSEISRAGRVRAVIARATTDDGDVVARERSDIPEDSRWINPPVPPESMLKDGPKKVRFRDRHRGACESSPTGNEKKKYLALRAGAAARVSFPFPRRDDECARNPDRAPARPSRRVSLATHPLTRSFPFFPFLSSLARADVLGAFLLGAYGEDCARGHRGDGCDARRASPRARHPGLRRQRRHGHRRRHRRRRLHPRHLRSRRCASDPRGGPRGSPAAARRRRRRACLRGSRFRARAGCLVAGRQSAGDSTSG